MVTFIVSTSRRRGIGAALCEQAAVEAAQLGIGELFLATTAPAGFYERRGWTMLIAGSTN
ncbi:MAG: GNAT family N-acetyltransferase [Pirellulaceae bacterium]|nr:GNAT family N-acetyltransferase [Pirellulaceae bacterium]